MAAGTITTSSLCPGCSDVWMSRLNHVTRWRNRATVCLTLSWWRCHLPSPILAKLILPSKTAPWRAPCKADSKQSMEHLPTRKVSPYSAPRPQTGWKTSTAGSVSNPDSTKSLSLTPPMQLWERSRQDCCHLRSKLRALSVPSSLA